MYSGAVAMVGSTEVSYSYPHQDFFALNGRSTGNHYWDKNNAYFAFFWDGILDHELKYGAVGDALRWAHNRYIATHDYTINPFNVSDTLYLQDWKQVAEYVLYGDPAFIPWQPKIGNNSVDEWHNGYNEGLENESLNKEGMEQRSRGDNGSKLDLNDETQTENAVKNNVEEEYYFEEKKLKADIVLLAFERRKW
jgi:hypothetical protein